MKNQPSPSIRQLAKLADVSPTTVSLALRNDPRLKPETNQRIQALACQAGYHVKPGVAQLMSRLQATRRMSLGKLAYLTGFDTESGWRANENSLRYFEGANERAYQLGYEIDPIWSSQPGMRAQRMSQILLTRNIRGVLLAPAAIAHSELKLEPESFSMVALGQTIEEPGINRASHDAYSGMFTALEHLLESSHQRIAYVNDEEEDGRVRNEWHSAFLYSKSTQCPDRLLSPYIFREWNGKAFMKWYQRARPDAILSNRSHPVTYLRENGISVPGDVSFYSLDVGVQRGKEYCGVDQCPLKVGEAGVELLISMLHNNNYGIQEFPRHIRVKGRWFDAKRPGKPEKHAATGANTRTLVNVK